MGMITEIRPEPRDNFIDGIKPRGYVHWEILDEDDNVIKRGYGAVSYTHLTLPTIYSV